MENENIMPLTLAEEVPNAAPVAVKQKQTSLLILNQDGRVDASKYTPDQIAKYKGMGVQLKSGDNNAILTYGTELQQKIAGHSETFLTGVRAFDAGEIGTSITDLLTELEYVDIDPSQIGPLKRALMSIPILKSLVINTKKIFQKYDSVKGNIDGIVKKLDQGRITILKDNTGLQVLFEKNLVFIRELEELIIAGQLNYNDLEAELKDMEQNAANYEDYEISDKREFLSRLSKRITDMMITRTITIQSIPQIRLVQTNNATMAEKIQASILTTIPLWKQQIAIAVALMRQKNIAEVQKKISETTNTLLEKNAEMLKTNSVMIAKENEKTIVSIETLHSVNQKLIETLTEVRQIKIEGEQSRKEAAKKLESIESELKKNVLQLS